MSGIVGIINTDGAPMDARLLEAMTDALRFRGPDGQRVWRAGAAGLGHTALHTRPSAQACPQPLILEELVLTGDIRLDGVSELRDALTSAGCRLQSNADDAMLVLHAYQAWGAHCLRHLAGDFCFGIWDARERTLFCARDQMGVRPLFYAVVKNVFVFSNTLACIRMHPGVSDRLNDATVADFLMLGHLREASPTFFRDIQRLPAAHAIRIHGDEVRLTRYWEPPTQQTRRGGRAADYAEEFVCLLRRAVAERVRQTKVGVLLSGGMDSTSVAAIARAQRSEGSPKVAAVTAGYDRLFADQEPRWAKRVADALEIEWQYVPSDELKLFASCARPDVPLPEPVGDPARVIMLECLSRLAAHGRTALTGEGGDVIVGVPCVGHGFRLRHLPGAMSYFLEYRRLPRIGLRSAVQKRAGRNPAPPFPAWFNPDLERSLELPSRWKELHKPEPVVHPTRPYFFQKLVNPFWSFVFEGLDPGVSGRNVALSHPLLSVAIIEFAFSTPVHFSNFVDKGLLRKAMRGVLPEEVRRRPKSPMPVDVVSLKLKERQWDSVCDAAPAPEILRYLKPGTPVSWSVLPEQSPAGWERVPLIGLNCWLRRQLGRASG